MFIKQVVFSATKYHCNYCFGDCSGLRVSCAECSEFDACLHVSSTILLESFYFTVIINVTFV